MTSIDDKQLGEIAVKYHFINAEALRQCRLLQQRNHKSLGQVLLQQGYLTESGLVRLLAILRKTKHERESRQQAKSRRSKIDQRFAQTVLAQQWVNPQKIDECLRLQHKRRRKDRYYPLAEVMLAKGYLTYEQVNRAYDQLPPELDSGKRYVTFLYCPTCDNQLSYIHNPPKELTCQGCGRKRVVCDMPAKKKQLPRRHQTKTMQPVKVLRLGKYILLNELGRGAMGVVYRARNYQNGKIVAVKVLPAQVSLNAQTVERFLREAHSAAAISHPNIVPILEINQHQGTHYYVMEFVQGRSLEALIETAPLPIQQAVQITIKIAQALHSVHQQGVIHRDIKPENIMMTNNGEPMITDFGLARMKGTATLTSDGAAIGTPVYMSPEQIRGVRKEIDHRCDIYSLGTTLYDMLSQELPFAGENYAEIAIQILTSDPMPIRKFRPDIPRDLELIIAKAMAKEPEERYATAQLFAQDLENFMAQRKVMANPGQWRRGLTYLRHHREIVIIIILSTILLVLLLTLVWVHIRKTPLHLPGSMIMPSTGTLPCQSR